MGWIWIFYVKKEITIRSYQVSQITGIKNIF